MRSGDVAGVRAAAPEEAMSFAFLDERARLLFGDVRGDRTEDEVDRVEDGGAHQEVLEVVREVADDLLRQVLVQVALGAAERRDERPDLRGVPLVEGRPNELER